ncbi:hypothetical protein N8152_02545, partial [bacterium]|nr:hypothetical protein [bacterium]
ENAVFSLEECRRRGWRRVAVVTNRFHQWRAERTFRVAAREAEAREEGGESYGESDTFKIFTAEMPLELERTTQFPPPGMGCFGPGQGAMEGAVEHGPGNGRHRVVLRERVDLTENGTEIQSRVKCFED